MTPSYGAPSRRPGTRGRPGHHGLAGHRNPVGNHVDAHQRGGTWRGAHAQDLVSGAVAAVTSVLPGRSDLDIGALTAHFAARCRAVVRVPYDPHLEEGGAVDLGRLRPAALAAFRQLAALVADGFTDRPRQG